MRINQIYYFLLALLVPSVVISFAANSLILILLSIFSIYIFKVNQKKIIWSKYLLFNSFIGTVLIGLIIDFSNHNHVDPNQIIKRLSFLLLPIIASASTKDMQKKALKFFVYFLSLVSSILLTAGFIRSIINKGQITYGNWDSDTTEAFYQQDMILNWGELSYKKLFFIFDMHPTYYALFSAIAIIILLFSGLFTSKNTTKWILVLLHSIIILMASSKTGVLSLFLIFTIYSLSNYNSKQLILGMVGITVLIIAILKIPSTELRFKRAVDSFSIQNIQSNNSSTSERIRLWSTITQISAKEFLLGIGHAGAKNKILEITGKDKNMHNQFLQAILSSGIIGLILLICLILSPLFYWRNPFTLSLVSILFLNLLFENLLDRIWGITIISFFYSLIIFGELDAKITLNKKFGIFRKN